MGSSGLGARTVTATKWSLITQLASKLISPLTTIALARILAPEAIGVVSLVTMVTSFADLFSDAGFQKYLIQHEYCDERELGLSADVAFWTNLAVSLLLWGGVVLLRDQVASMVGNSSIGPAVSIACGSLPLTAAISVQTAVYQRVLDFRTLFWFGAPSLPRLGPFCFLRGRLLVHDCRDACFKSLLSGLADAEIRMEAIAPV